MSNNTFVYTGTVTRSDLSTTEIIHGTNPVITQTKTDPFMTTRINWDKIADVPPSIRDLTPAAFVDSQVLKRGGSSVEVSYIAYGRSTYGALILGQTGLSSVLIQGKTGSFTTSFITKTNDVGAPWGVFSLTPISQDIGLPVLTKLTHSYPPNNTGIPPGYYPDQFDVRFSITLKFTAVIRCDSDFLQSPICLDLCTGSDAARTSCANAYLDYCTKNNLENLRAPPPPGETQNICEAFVQDYAVTNSTTRTDGALSDYCSKFDSFEELATTGTPQDQQLCGCHMQPAIYDDFAKNLGLQYPNIAALYANATKCAIPLCVNSPYPSVEVLPGKCKAPLCFQTIIIETNGKIDPGGVNADQRCDISNNDGGGGGKPTNYVPLLIGLFVILLVIMIGLYMASR